MLAVLGKLFYKVLYSLNKINLNGIKESCQVLVGLVNIKHQLAKFSQVIFKVLFLLNKVYG